MDSDDPDERESIRRFETEINRTIDYFRREYSLAVASAVGTLEIIKQQLVAEALEDEGDE